MTASTPDPYNPQPTPDNPNPEPARPPMSPETPEPDEPPGVPPPSPDSVPSPGEEPIQIPPETPSEVPPQPGFPAPTAIRASFLAAVLLSWIVAVSPTAAQTSDDGPDVTAPTDPCRAQPDDQAEADEGEAKNQDDRTGNDPRPALEDCNGVLTPPRTGDQEIEGPPPDTGTTPVIPPETVPEQPPG